MAKSEIAERIEKDLERGYKSERQTQRQTERLRIVNEAFERGGESAAYYADMMFVVGHTD